MTKSAKQLAPQLTKHLLAYSAIAGAALVGASPAHAQVVYTPTHARVNGNFYIDLDHDGIADFHISSYELSGDGSILVFPLHPENKIAGTLQLCASGAAAALNAGVIIGPHLKFSNKANCMALSFGSFYEGAWLDATDRYLGLVFVIDGQKHYGWARLSVDTTEGFRYGYAADVFGYAYESVPNMPIKAGDEGQSAETFAPTGTLGELALGASKSALRERK
jgi:hypothetical protein